MPVIELVVFRCKEGVSREAMITAALSITPILQAMSGFLSRQFGATPDGQYADIVQWASRGEAERAAEAAMKTPACGPFFSLIDQKSMQMFELDTFEASG